MFRRLTSIAAFGAGIAVVYLFDPNAGRRRRAVMRDRIGRGFRDLQTALDKALRDLGQRAQGFAAQVQSGVRPRNVSDRVLGERVRSKMGRYVSHPSAIQVDANDGQIVLSGPILADEVESFVAAIRRIPGVRTVGNYLDVHRAPGRVSALQGGKRPTGEHWNIAEENWAPATRLCATAAGGLLTAYALTQRFPIACALGAAGLGLCVAAARRNHSGRASQRAPLGGEIRRDEHARRTAASSSLK